MKSASSWGKVCVLAAGALLAVLATGALQAQGDAVGAVGAGKIDGWVIENTRAGAQAEFFVVMAEQANLAPSREIPGKLGKGRFVYHTLFKEAQRSQKAIRAELDAGGVEYRSFYLVNAILVKGDRNLATRLAARPDVARIDGNPEMRLALPQPQEPEPLEWNPDWSPNLAEGLIPQITAVEPGINYVRAPQIWSLGYTGQGVVVAGADTGYRWTHAALKNAYRGWNGTTASHDYNWHDSIHSGTGPCGANAAAPCDDQGHGSHTMGTIVGLDGANQVGMAPGARWIGCRNMNQGAGTPASYLECMEFFLAPYPVGGTTAQGDPSKAPHVTNNSWGCNAAEGCTTPNILLTGVTNTRAAGILMEVSAGNSGPGCSTVADPPSFYDPSFTTGALTTGTDSIASFSSRGPVTADGSNRIKPDIVAPGTSTRSSYNTSDTTYTSLSGTSMAGPHVVGGVALLLSAFPSLTGNPNGIESRLTSSAKPITLTSTTCGSAAGAVPNNVYGYGRLDVGCAIPAKVSGSTSVCAGSPATLTVNLVGSGPWTLTWSDGTVQSGVATNPATRMLSPTVATTYSLTSVSSTGCNQPGAGSATISMAPPLSNTTIAVAGSTTIGSPCLGGTATVTDTGGGTSSHQWGYRTVSGGTITNLTGQTGTSYVLNCANFPTTGSYFLVERTTPGCGSTLISNEVPVTVTAVAPPTPVTVIFNSVAAQDGRLWEVGETSNVGGGGNSTDNTTAALRVGDTNVDEQYKSLVSFDTSSIPDTATITSATLRLVRGTSSGTNPFTTHGSCLADIVTGGFGGSTAFAFADWQAAATATGVATMSNPTANGSASTGNLNAAGLAAINKTGTTQLRLTFTLDDNDDSGYDYIGFYAGENATTSNKPQLTVVYTP
ncbi:MAG TPA: S8 family serine peptidase [Thermoanaerobaculia bacterium]|jgi:subtilisin family serine protease|nr:S8 family serine peptidase [Thermoanaerobaculia bacterium]